MVRVYTFHKKTQNGVNLHSKPDPVDKQIKYLKRPFKDYDYVRDFGVQTFGLFKRFNNKNDYIFCTYS